MKTDKKFSSSPSFYSVLSLKEFENNYVNNETFTLPDFSRTFSTTPSVTSLARM